MADNDFRDKAAMEDETTINAAIERFVRKRLPPGGESVLVRVSAGPPQRGILYRTRKPFPSLVRKFKGPDGGPFKFQVLSSDDGYVLVTWS